MMPCCIRSEVLGWCQFFPHCRAQYARAHVHYGVVAFLGAVWATGHQSQRYARTVEAPKQRLGVYRQRYRSFVRFRACSSR